MNKQELLINGFIRNILLIPSDLINLIIKFCMKNSYLLSFSCKHNYLQSLNLSSAQFIEKEIYCSPADTKGVDDIVTGSNGNVKQYQCIISDEALPINIANQLISNKSIKLTEKEIFSNEWSMIIQEPHGFLTAFLPSIFYSNSANDIGAFRFILPPNVDFYHENPIYDKSRKKLYIGHGDYPKGGIYSLDFKHDNTKDDEKIYEDFEEYEYGLYYGWHWKQMTENTKCVRPNASYCMIDNDKYIGIMGGILPIRDIPLKQFELYAINSDQSIWLKNMIQPRMGAVSLYHNELYKILCGGGSNSYDGDDICNNMEWYDINKDVWCMITHPLPAQLCNIWISPINPYIIYLSQSIHNQYMVQTIDLRQNNTYKNLIDIKLESMNSFGEPCNALKQLCHPYSAHLFC